MQPDGSQAARPAKVAATYRQATSPRPGVRALDQRGRGDVGLDRVRPDPAAAGSPPRQGGRARPLAVLLDRDGTLVVDVPYNAEPDRVVLMPTAVAALDRLRAARIPTAVVSNQSGIARGLLTREQVDAVNTKVAQLLGPVGPFFVCPHAPGDGCACRKPAPGMVFEAAAALGVPASSCALVGDIGADVEAALAAGARPVLVPTATTRPEEIAAAPEVAANLVAAVELLLDGPVGAA